MRQAGVRALAARLVLREGRWDSAVQALAESGPWQADSDCRNLLAFAKLQAMVAGARLVEAEL